MDPRAQFDDGSEADTSPEGGSSAQAIRAE